MTKWEPIIAGTVLNLTSTVGHVSIVSQGSTIRYTTNGANPISRSALYGSGLNFSPYISSISPDTPTNSMSSQYVSVFGSNFQSGLTVEVRRYVGPYNVLAFDWAGSDNPWTYEHAFFLAPTVSHISPRVVARGQSFSLDIKGSGFDRSGYVTSVVPYNWGGVKGWALYGHLGEGGSSQQPQVVSSILSPYLRTRDLPNLDRIFDRRPPVVVQTSSAEIRSISQDLLYWAQLLGALMLPFGLISTNILGWVLYHKSRVEARMKEAEHRLEMEKMKLEIEKLTFEVAKARSEAPAKPMILLS